MTDSRLSRRTMLRGGIAAISAAAVGGPLLTACSGDSAEDSKAAASANAGVKLPTYVRYEGVEPDLEGNAAGVTDAFFAYPAKPVKATDDIPGDGTPITAIVETSSPIPPGVDKNLFWQELNSRVGSELKLTITPASDFATKFATTIAGGELPDMAEIAGGTRQLPQLLKATAQDLTEFLSGDAVKDYPYLANIPEASWRGCVFNGGIYGIPVPRGVASTAVVYRRDDLLKAKGIDAAVGSFDDFMALCQEVNDPKGRKWALATAPLDYLRQMLGIANGWKEEGGKLVSANEAPEQKDALAAAVKLLKADLVHPDSFADSVHEQAKTWFNAGYAYMIMDTYSALPGFYQQNVAGEAFDVGIMDVPGYDSGEGQVWLGNPTHNITAFKKGDKARIETLLKVANWMAAPFGTEEYLFRRYGIAGHDYDLRGTDPVLNQLGNSETQLGGFCIQYLTDAPQALYYPGLKQVAQREYDHQQKYVPNGLVNPTTGLYSDTGSRQGGPLGEKLADAQTAILQGRQPVSSWDDAVKKWKSEGGDTIRAEYEDALAHQ